MIPAGLRDAMNDVACQRSAIQYYAVEWIRLARIAWRATSVRMARAAIQHESRAS